MSKQKSNIVLHEEEAEDPIVTFANATLQFNSQEESEKEQRSNATAEKFYQHVSNLDAKTKYSFCHGGTLITDDVTNSFLCTLNLTFIEWQELTAEYKDGGSADINDMAEYVKMRMAIKKKKKVKKVVEDDDE